MPLVYVGTFTDDPEEGIHRFRLDPSTGALEPVGVTRGVPNPFFLTIDARGHRLYAANALDELDGEPSGAVSAFAVDPRSGELTYLGRRPSRGALPCYLSLDRAGRNLLVGNYNSGSVACLPVAQDGCLQPATAFAQHQGSGPDQERQEGPHVHSIVLDPSERFALSADLGIDRVMVYAFDAAAGSLTPADPPSVAVHDGAGPRHLAFHPNGRFLYLLNELDATVTVFAYDGQAGRLEARQALSALPDGFEGSNYAADLLLLPSGGFLYTSNRGHDSIAAFRVDAASSRLTLVGHVPAGGSWPWNLALDPSATFLLAANYESDCVATFHLDSETGLPVATGHTAAAPKPVCVEVLR